MQTLYAIKAYRVILLADMNMNASTAKGVRAVF
jgi:hypothetical protein